MRIFIAGSGAHVLDMNRYVAQKLLTFQKPLGGEIAADGLSHSLLEYGAQIGERQVGLIRQLGDIEAGVSVMLLYHLDTMRDDRLDVFLFFALGICQDVLIAGEDMIYTLPGVWRLQ